MAVDPRLLNPTKITFAQKTQSSNQAQDHLRRTRRNVIQRDAEFQIDGQIKWNMAGSLPEMSQVGVDEEERGYIILRTKDLTALGKEIKRGDRITKIEEKEVSFYVLRTEFGSHYGGDFKLVKVVFADRDGQNG